MLHKVLGIFLILVALLPLSSQGQNRPSPEPPPPYISLRFPPSNDLKAKQQALEKRLDDYVTHITGGAKKSQVELNKNSRKYVSCLHQRLLSKNLGSFGDIMRLCPDTMFEDREIIQQLGLQTPEDFNKSLAREAQELQAKIEKFDEQDVVVVVEDYLQLTEIPGEKTDLKKLDTQVTSLSKDVQSIVVKLHQSPNVQTYARELEASGVNSGKEELLELSELLTSLSGNESDCVKLEDLKNEHPEKKLLRYLQGATQDGSETGAMFLGIKTQEDLTKLKSFRFYDGDNFYYLYQGQTTNNNENRWVLARLDKQGEVSFRFYQIVTDIGRGDALATSKDLKLLKPLNHQTAFKSGKNSRMYFQAQEGLVLKRKNISAPVIGTSSLPSGDLIISRVNMTYVANKTFNQNNLTLTQESVGLESVSSPRSNFGAWSASGGVKYFPLKDKWSVSGNVRVYNFLLGYSDNLSGSQSAQGTYIFHQNFVSVNTDLKNEFRASAGRQFLKGRGAATLTTDFKKTTELKVIFLVQ